MLNLFGKVAIVTGASSGIGRAIAICFAQRGVRVVLAARNVDNLNVVALEIGSADTLVVPTDVTKVEDCKHLIDATIEHFGSIDVIVCNAGISMRADFDKLNIDVIHRVIDVNFFGVVRCVRYAIPYLLKSRGTVVCINSIAGYLGLPGRSGYSASKFALRGFFETLRTEYINTGLNVCMVSPSFTASNIRLHALTADGSEQKMSPRNEKSMMTAEHVATVVYKAILYQKREVILSFWQGRLPVWLHRRFPKLTNYLVYKFMSKEKK
ncbi:MAG: SDR family oxidoreductase [Marinilabiliaceae bacterium]|nr:SDR family oxidoreductase [Marinilabiliaceae bacterium]